MKSSSFISNNKVFLFGLWVNQDVFLLYFLINVYVMKNNKNKWLILSDLDWRFLCGFV